MMGHPYRHCPPPCSRCVAAATAGTMRGLLDHLAEPCPECGRGVGSRAPWNLLGFYGIAFRPIWPWERARGGTDSAPAELLAWCRSLFSSGPRVGPFSQGGV